MEIDNINDITTQNIQFQLKDNSIIYITLKFLDNINCWFMNIQYKNFTLNNIQLTYNDNILSQYENILPFGIQITSKSGFNPMGRQCFINKDNAIIINEKVNND